LKEIRRLLESGNKKGRHSDKDKDTEIPFPFDIEKIKDLLEILRKEIYQRK